MSKLSWIPGLPSGGPAYDLWMLDYSDQPRPNGSNDLMFLVVDNGEEAELLANRTGGPARLDGRWLGRFDHEKTSVELGSRTGLIKYWAVLEDDDAEIETRAPPKSMLGQLPECDITATEFEHLCEELDS
jgi:hypothetical protein